MIKKILVSAFAFASLSCLSQDQMTWSKTTDSEKWNKENSQYPEPIFCQGQRTAMTSVEVDGRRETSTFRICEFNKNFIILACGEKGQKRVKVKIGDYVQCPEDPSFNNPLKTVDVENKRIERDKTWLTVTIRMN